MKRPQNRLETYENRSEKPTSLEPEKASIVGAETRLGISCPYCKTKGQSVVRRTYPIHEEMYRRGTKLYLKRTRFCNACKRPFTTREVPD